MHSLPRLFPFRAFYGWQYLAYGALYPFLALYLSAAGFDGVQMGLLFGLTPLIALVVMPVWGVLADTLGVRRRLLTTVCLLAALTALLLPFAPGIAATMAVMLALTIFRSPIMPVANAITLDALGRRRDLFPQIRMVGSATFAIATLLVGWWVVDTHIGWTVYIYAAGMLVATLATLRLPRSQARFNTRWWEAWHVAKGNTAFLVFSLALVTLQFTHPLASAYLPLFLKDLGAPGWMIGAAWGIAAGLEVPFMAATPWLMRRFGGKTVLVIFTAAVPLRWLLYSLITNPIYILPLQFLHSATAAAYYAAAVTYVDTLTPPEWKATGQSLFSALSDGIGIGGGSLAFGIIYQRWGLAMAFSVGAAIALVGWLILVFGVSGRAAVPAPLKAEG
ncbi:MAG: MFS transporter [Anaerolineae bacterium]